MSLTIEAGECSKKKGSAIVFTEPFQRTHEIITPHKERRWGRRKFLHSMGKNNLSVLVLVVLKKNLGRRRRNYNLPA